MGWEKVACSSTKAAVSLKCIKIEEKLLWSAYRNSPVFFRMVPFLTPYCLPSQKIWGLQPAPKTSVSIISGMGKAMDFKFGQYIHKVHPNKSPLKILEIREHGHIWGLPNFLCTPIISGTGKATNFQFCRHIYGLNRNESPSGLLGKVAVGVVSDTRKFSGNPCIGRIARSALR